MRKCTAILRAFDNEQSTFLCLAHIQPITAPTDPETCYYTFKAFYFVLCKLFIVPCSLLCANRCVQIVYCSLQTVQRSVQTIQHFLQIISCVRIVPLMIKPCPWKVTDRAKRASHFVVGPGTGGRC